MTGSTTFVPGGEGFVPEETPSVISNSSRSISSTPRRRNLDVNPVNSNNVTSTSSGEKLDRTGSKERKSPQAKKRNRIWLSVLISLVIVALISAGGYSAVMGYFGEIPFLSTSLTPIPASIPPLPSSTIMPVLNSLLHYQRYS